MDTATLTPQQRRLHDRIEDPRARARWAPRSQRRALVSTLVGVSLLSVVLLTVAVVMDSPVAFVPFVVAIVLGVGIVYLSAHVYVAARWAPGYPGLDEFQRAEMDRAALTGHSLTTVLLTVLIAVTSGIGGAMVSVELPGTLVIAILLPLVFLTAVCHSAFPAARLAWTRPDELPEDEDLPVRP